MREKNCPLALQATNRVMDTVVYSFFIGLGLIGFAAKIQSFYLNMQSFGNISLMISWKYT